MDPVSFAASVIAIVGAARKAGKGISKLRDLFEAPDQIDALENELSSLQIILGDLHFDLENEPTSSIVPQNLLSIVERARTKVQELEEILEYQVKKPSGPEGNARPRRIAWTRKKEKIIRLQQDLRSIRTDLNLGCNSFFMCVQYCCRTCCIDFELGLIILFLAARTVGQEWRSKRSL